MKTSAYLILSLLLLPAALAGKIYIIENGPQTVGNPQNYNDNETAMTIYGGLNITGNITMAGSTVCTPGNGLCAAASDTNNYTTSISVSGTTTKTLNLARSGAANLTATWTDIDTDTWNTTSQMRAAINDSTLTYAFKLNASNILNPPWLTSYTETDTLAIARINTLNNLSITQISANIGNWSADKASYALLNYVNTLGNWSGNASNYVTTASTSSWDKNTADDLTIPQVAANLGNWTGNASSYVTTASTTSWDKDATDDLSLASVATNLGNWSGNASNYVTTASTSAWDKNAADDLTLTTITTSIGNWSADKASYALISYVNTLGNWSGNASNYVTTASTANWDKDASDDTTLTTVATNIGNWSGNASSYVTTASTSAWDKNAADDFNGAWASLTDKPAGFADDTDNDTTYTAGLGLNLSSTTFNLNTTWTDARYYLASNPTGYITAAQVPAAETDSAHDTCAEITGCVVGAITSVPYQSAAAGWTNTSALTQTTMVVKINNTSGSNALQVIQNNQSSADAGAVDVTSYNLVDTALNVNSYSATHSNTKLQHFYTQNVNDSVAAVLGLFTWGPPVGANQNGTEAKSLYIMTGNSTGATIMVDNGTATPFLLYPDGRMVITSNNTEALKVQSASGTLRFGVNPASGVITVGGKMIPDSDGGRDLGDSTHRIRHLYINGVLHNGTTNRSINTIIAGEADTLDGQHGSYYLNTSGGYATLTTTTTLNGNWSADKPNYNVKAQAATYSTLNITTGNVNITGAGSCVYLPGGGRLCGNTTCTWMVSPDGWNMLKIANNNTAC